MRVIIGYNSN